MIQAAARYLFWPPGLQKEDRAKADGRIAARIQKEYPILWDSLIEAKVVTLTGALPERGGLNDQTGGLRDTLEWLATMGHLEWLNRSPPGAGL